MDTYHRKVNHTEDMQ